MNVNMNKYMRQEMSNMTPAYDAPPDLLVGWGRGHTHSLPLRRTICRVCLIQTN